MNTPFLNDMFSLVDQGFRNLYPNKEYKCQWVPELEDNDEGKGVLGHTIFYEDGDVEIEISGRLKVVDAVEVFAHELAHVAVGNDKGHGPEWEEAFDKIFNEYNRIGNELFNRHEPVPVVSGKEYVNE